MKTIDMTPTWEGVLPIYIAGIQSGSFEGIKTATKELERMARLADMHVAAQTDRDLTWSMDSYPPKWERPVLLALVKAILNRGYQISIYLEDEAMIEHSSDLAEVIKNLAAGDLDSLVIETEGRHSVGWFSLIYNNGSEQDPMVVISDFSDNDLCNEIMSDIDEELAP